MMTRAERTGLAAVLGIAACLAESASASAAEPRAAVPVHVVAIKTDDAYDQAEALTKALRAALRNVQGWSLGEGDFSLEVLMLSLKCGDVPDDACQTRIGDQIKTDHYIWGSLSKKDGTVEGTLHLWARGEPAKSTSIEYSANLTEANDEVLRKIAVDTLVTLTGGAPKGSLHVKSSAPSGQVLVDGKPMGALTHGEATFEIAAGPHRVLIKAPGYLDAESSVVVQPVSTAEVALSLMAVTPPSPVNWKRIGGFVGITAGVAFATGGVISTARVLSLRQDDAFKEYKALFSPDVNNVCATERREQIKADKTAPTGVAARGIELCDDADTLVALQWVFYPLAALSAGVGAYLIATSAPHEERPQQAGWSVQPTVGLDAGKVDVTYRW